MERPRKQQDKDYTTLPPSPALDQLVGTVDTDRTPDPDDVRNVDQHHALRED